MTNPILRKVLGYVGLALVLVGLLYVAYSHGYRNGTNAGAQAQATAVQGELDQRVAQEAAAKAKTEAVLVQQQQDTAKLNTTLQDVRSQLAHAQQDLSHAKLTNVHSTAPVAGRCPGSAIGSPDFIRLWNNAPADGSATAGGTGQALATR